MKYNLFYLSDGEMLEDKSIYIVDEERKNLPRGHYFISNCKVNDKQVDSLSIYSESGMKISPGTTKSVTPQLRVKKVYHEKVINDYFEPKEQFEPTFGNRLPYESMFRTMLKMYGIKTNEELDLARNELDPETADEEDRYVLSQFGLLNETPSEPSGDEINKEVQTDWVPPNNGLDEKAFQTPLELTGEEIKKEVQT